MTTVVKSRSTTASLKERPRPRGEIRVLIDDTVQVPIAEAEERELLATVGLNFVEQQLAAIEGEPSAEQLQQQSVAREQLELARTESEAARQALGDATVVLLLEAQTAVDYRDLLDAHKASDQQQKQQPEGMRLMFDPDTYPPALILASLSHLDPGELLDVEQWLPTLSLGEFEAIFGACWDLNRHSRLMLEFARTGRVPG